MQTLDVKTKEKAVDKKREQRDAFTLPSIQIFADPYLKLLFDQIPLAIVACTTIMTFAGLYTRSGVDLLYLTGGLASIVAILFIRTLFEQFPQILLLIWRRNILRPKHKENSFDPTVASPETKEMFLGFVQDISKKMNHSVGTLCGILGVLVAIWLIWLLDIDILKEIFTNFRASALWYGIMTFVRLTYLIFGFVVGVVGWRILVIANTVSSLGKLFNFDLQINHPDGCGGLRPIGDLCLKLAYVISPLPILLGSWLIFINFFDIRFLRMTPENIDPLSSTIIFLAIPTAILCLLVFFAPLGSIHTAMLRAKSELQIELDNISREIHQLSSSLLKKANDLAPQQGTPLEEKIEFLKRVYARNSQIPTWPYRSTHVWGLISTQIIPSLGVISSIIGFIRGL
jgi:hypothetical protein